MRVKEENPTEIMKSSDIGPIANLVIKLSGVIRSSESQSIISKIQ